MHITVINGRLKMHISPTAALRWSAGGWFEEMDCPIDERALIAKRAGSWALEAAAKRLRLKAASGATTDEMIAAFDAAEAVYPRVDLHKELQPCGEMDPAEGDTRVIYDDNNGYTKDIYFWPRRAPSKRLAQEMVLSLARARGKKFNAYDRVSVEVFDGKRWSVLTKPNWYAMED